MAKREKNRLFFPDRKLLVFVGLVAGFTILGPFGTYEILSVWERLIFWSLVMTSVGLFMHLGITMALEGALFSRLPRPLRIVVGAMVAAVPSVAVLLFLIGYVYPTPMSPDAFPQIWAQVAFIGAIVGQLEYRLSADVGEREAAAFEPVLTRLHRRLPEGESHDIISLTVRDHYVDVTTTTGRHMLLMRLIDAIEELDGLPGERLHRSHWAASDHIAGLTKRGPKYVVTLSDGRELPVSKSYVDAVAGRVTSS